MNEVGSIVKLRSGLSGRTWSEFVLEGIEGGLTAVRLRPLRTKVYRSTV